jgi:hypothetical protein
MSFLCICEVCVYSRTPYIVPTCHWSLFFTKTLYVQLLPGTISLSITLDVIVIHVKCVMLLFSRTDLWFFFLSIMSNACILSVVWWLSWDQHVCWLSNKRCTLTSGKFCFHRDNWTETDEQRQMDRDKWTDTVNRDRWNETDEQRQVNRDRCTCTL